VNLVPNNKTVTLRNLLHLPATAAREADKRLVPLRELRALWQQKEKLHGPFAALSAFIDRAICVWLTQPIVASFLWHRRDDGGWHVIGSSHYAAGILQPLGKVFRYDYDYSIVSPSFRRLDHAALAQFLGQGILKTCRGRLADKSWL